MDLHIDFGKTGLMEIGDQRFAFYPMDLTQEYGECPVFRCHIIGDAFSVSNAIARNNRNLTIKNVVFNDPATVVMWSDGTKTVVKCQPGDVYSKETGLALCIAKKFLGNKSKFNEVFKRWIPEENTKNLIR